ncbi:class I tRNA ligase family protein [Streptosporangium vulgare]|uniref:class I tRNA ligase family protein n=1 Tax=Streptosporangium vulgare TaxID=46190 RepID=UPI0031D5A9EA
MPDVIDAWYDSGSMPFAQWGAPYLNEEMLEKAYPAQFICEGHRPDPRLVLLADGGRHASSSAGPRTRTCSAVGLILAEDGRKMSKHLGNVLKPMPLMDQHGAERAALVHGLLRLAVGGPQGGDHGALEEIVRKVLLTLLEHHVVLHPVRQHRVLVAVPALRGARVRRAPADRPVGPRRAAPDRGRGHRVAGRLRHRPASDGASPSSSTTCPTGTCAAPGAASGPATPPRSPRCTSAWRPSPG